jgi:uncharacterized protein YoxC
MLERILAILYEPITNKIGAVMASVEELQASVNNLQTALEQAKQRITADVDNLRAQIDQLQVDEAALTGVRDALDSLTTNVGAIDPDPNFPPAEPTP